MKKKIMLYSEFIKKYQKPNASWDFNKFKIVCVKCNSKMVEFSGEMELSSGYYYEPELNGEIVVKCHECGNAFTMDSNKVLQ